MRLTAILHRKSWFYIVPVSILSILVNIPKVWTVNKLATNVLNFSHFQFLEAEVHWMDDVNAIEILEEQVTSLAILILFPRGSLDLPSPRQQQ